MLLIENIDIWGFQHAVRGMRNPMNSWDKSDSYIDFDTLEGKGFYLGKEDLKLMKKLIKGGSEHRKFLRQIMVSMDITAPLYWWKEFDTYKIGTTVNSCSTMHKIHSKEFVPDDFSKDHLDEIGEVTLQYVINRLNIYRTYYLETKDKDYWWNMIQLLPSSYNQKRTITMNYENVLNIIHQRTGHKLDEWNILVSCFRQFPYMDELLSD